MIDEADYWWERQEANLTTWEQAKEAVLRVYGDRNKQRNSVTKIKNLQQGSRTISAFFTEADTLNIYAQLDPQVSKVWKDARELVVIVRVIERAKGANRMAASRQ